MPHEIPMKKALSAEAPFHECFGLTLCIDFERKLWTKYNLCRNSAECILLHLYVSGMCLQSDAMQGNS